MEKGEESREGGRRMRGEWTGLGGGEEEVERVWEIWEGVRRRKRGLR